MVIIKIIILIKVRYIRLYEWEIMIIMIFIMGYEWDMNGYIIGISHYMILHGCNDFIMIP